MTTCVRCGCRPFEHSGEGKCQGRGGSCKCTTVSRVYFRPRKARVQSKLRDPGNPRRDYSDFDDEEAA
jgi:hypothetical protein